jgi:tetratricopeptide (TPR) repeat protein
MNTYEFWNDMDKIYDAILAFQEKSIEFNKQFINPWVKLGNVFDKNESAEEIIAHKNAIEIDPKNAQNWYELANIYTRTGDFEKSIQAYKRAIELGFETGELYKNLALAYSITAKHQDAIHIFKKALEMLESNSEKAIVWNHLGNVYRKLDNYEMALQAFQQADQFESMKTSTVDELSATASQKDNVSQPSGEPATVMENIPVAENFIRAENNAVPINDPELDVSSTELNNNIDHTQISSVVHEVELPVAENDQVTHEINESNNDMQVILDIDFSSGTINEATDEADLEVNNGPFSMESIQEEPEANEETTEEVYENVDNEPFSLEPMQEELEANEETTDEVHEYVDNEPFFLESIQEELDTNKETGEENPFAKILATSDENEMLTSSEHANDANEEVETRQLSNDAHTLSAYENYLEDNDPDGNNLSESVSDETHNISMTPANVAVTNSEINMEANEALTNEMDSKNANVWNELGNVYFNAGSYDDAIAAYSKAIELDTQFAWPYTNLASSYVHKERLADAILMYERGIELFSDVKDKAVAWNQLGNVYRQMNDYGNAIAAYQRADELDPRNIAITQQSRFSLLGNEKIVQEAGYSV